MIEIVSDACISVCSCCALVCPLLVGWFTREDAKLLRVINFLLRVEVEGTGR